MMLPETYKSLVQTFFSDKPVKKVYVFGSFARNEADTNSDVDLLLELDYSEPIGMKFFTYQPALEKLLKTKVDVVTTDGLSKYIKPVIDKDKILIYERQVNWHHQD